MSASSRLDHTQVTRSPSQARLASLRVTEVFRSLQGEGPFAGLPTIFIRLTGCPLRCVWCDSAYAFHGGQKRDVESILLEARDLQANHICLTGGEPLAQPGSLDLLRQLCDEGYSVSLETSGALTIEGVDERVCVVMDLKAPGSAEDDRNLWSNLEHLKPSDQLKVVIAGAEDFSWLCRMDAEHRLSARCTLWVSPVWESCAPADLASWVLDSGKDYRLQLQLHKLLWGDEPGR